MNTLELVVERERQSPSLEEVVEAVRTLNMVRNHVGGWGELRITQSVKRSRGRVLEARLMVGSNRHAQYVKPELYEVVQPAAELLTKALEANWDMTIDTSARYGMTLSIKV